MSLLADDLMPSTDSILPAPEAPPTLTLEEKRKLIDSCEKKFKDAMAARSKMEQQWYMNMAFYFGKHYLQWTSQVAGVSNLWEPPAPAWRVRATVNKVRKLVRIEHSKFTKEEPQFYVLPTSTDDEDIAAARSGEQLATWAANEYYWKRIVRRAVFWMQMCGSSFIKAYWDPEAIDPAGVKGSTVFDPIPAFNVLAGDLQEQEVENQPWMMHVSARSSDWIKRAYPDANEVKSEVNV